MNKKVLIGLIVTITVAVAVLVSAIFAYPMIKNSQLKKDPVTYLTHAISESSSDAFDYSYKMKMKMDNEALSNLGAGSSDEKAMTEFVLSVVDQMSLNGRMKGRMDLKEGQSDLFVDYAIQYGENRLMSFNMGYANETAFMQIPELYKKAFVLEKSQITKYIENEIGFNLDKIELSNYLKHLAVQDTKEYKAFVDNYDAYEPTVRKMLSDLEKGESKEITTVDGKTYKCDTLSLNVDVKKLMDSYAELIEVAKKDENLKALTKSVMVNILNELKTSGDYALFGAKEADIDMAIAALDVALEENWDTAIQEMADTYRELAEQMADIPAEMSTQMTFAIDKDFIIRQMAFVNKVEGVEVIQEITLNAMGKDVVIDAPKLESSVKIMDLVENPDQMEAIYTEAITEEIPNFIKSETIKTVIEDIKAKAEVLPAAEKEAIVTQLDSLADSVSMMLMFMPNPFASNDYGYGDDEDDYDFTSDIDSKEVGDSLYGYFQIPSDYTKNDFGGYIQYMSADQQYGFNVHVAKDENNSDLEKVTQEMLAGLESELPGTEFEYMSSYFAGFEAVEFYSISGDILFDGVVFKDDDGNIRSFTFYGVDESIYDLFYLVDETFRTE